MIRVRVPPHTPNVSERLREMEAAIFSQLGIHVTCVEAPRPLARERELCGWDRPMWEPIPDEEPSRTVDAETTNWEDWAAAVDDLCAEVLKRVETGVDDFT